MGSLVVMQPGWLAVAFVIAATLTALLTAGSRPRRLSRAAMTGTAAALLGAWWLWIGTVAAVFVLGLAACTSGFVLARRLIRADAAKLSGLRRASLTGLRGAAWLVLLVLLARPGCDRHTLVYEKPVLAVLLDSSASMALPVDVDIRGDAARTRADAVNATLAATSSERARLEKYYDVRRLAVGADSRPVAAWTVEPSAPVTALARALRGSLVLRSSGGGPPAAVLLVSDGAETVADRASVLAAAEALAQQGVALHTIGVGPAPGATLNVELDPLQVPARVGLREVLHVSVTGRVQAADQRALDLAVGWDGETADRHELTVRGAFFPFASAFDLRLPGAGLHRLTVKATIAGPAGPQTFTTSAVLDVAVDAVRVLYLTRGPQIEAGFVARALGGDPTIAVTLHPLFDEPLVANDATQLITGYDVVILGALGDSPAAAGLATALVDAVSVRGVGLLRAGGVREPLLPSGAGALRELLPATTSAAAETPAPSVLRPTPAGLRHPVLRGVTGAAGASESAESGGWSALPPIDMVGLGTPRPTAQILATDATDRPVLAGMDLGRGRVLAAGWEATWIWALGSESGPAQLARLWRQMVAWLANRRPQAWVLTDDGEYARVALERERGRIAIRAGIAGLPAERSAVAAVVPDSARLELRSLANGGPPGRVVPLRRDGGEWSAGLPGADARDGALMAGRYQLEFSCRVRTGEHEDSLVGRTQFEVSDVDVERRSPTADLGLLQVAAQRTAGCGGSYRPLAELGDVLEKLDGDDRRQRLTVISRYDLGRDEPWGLLGWLILLLATEWALRKRSGLA